MAQIIGKRKQFLPSLVRIEREQPTLGMLAKKFREHRLANRVKRGRVEVEYVPLIVRALTVDQRHVELARGDQDDVPVLGVVDVGFAHVANIALLEYHELVVIVIVQARGIRALGVYRVAVGVGEHISDHVVFPVG